MDCPVTVTPHRSLNSYKGVIRCKELIDCDREEILSELKPQAVSDITNITVKDNSGGRKPNTFIATVKQTNTPQHIKIGYIGVLVIHIRCAVRKCILDKVLIFVH